MKKAYIVTLDNEFVVIAENLNEAQIIAEKTVQEFLYDADATIRAVKEADHYPNLWDEESLPYGITEEIELRYFMEKTPAYKKAKNNG